MSARPLGPRVVVRLEQESDISEGGLYLPETRARWQDKLKGTIEKLGTKGCEDLKVGDVVTFQRDNYLDVPGEPNLVVLRVDNILAIYASEDKETAEVHGNVCT